MTLVSRLVDPPVVVVEVPTDATAEPLHPDEDAVLGRVVESRRREFTLGRHCARLALERLGVPLAPILPGPTREPLWPAGVAGSISHCALWCAAAAAPTALVASIGVDVEIDEPLPDEVIDLVLISDEREWLGAAPPGICWDRLLFSAKESVYKAWYPLMHRWLGFEDVCVRIDPKNRVFSAELLSTRLVVDGRDFTGLGGRFDFNSGILATAIIVPQPGDIATRTEGEGT